jgi:hypothetical protein
MALKSLPKRDKNEEPVVPHIPDVFDEDEKETVAPAKQPVTIEVETTEITINGVEETPEEATEDEVPDDVVSEPTPSDDLPLPDLPRSSRGMTTSVEEVTSSALPESEPVMEESNLKDPELPAFFSEPQVEKKEEKTPVVSMLNTPQTKEEKILEAAIPQAFVGELAEVSKEVKREKKGALITTFIVVGMILIAAGLVGLYWVTSRKSMGNTQPTPTPTVVATPVPTPLIIIHDTPASSSASMSAQIKKALKVNVLNGTKVVGLAAKEASVLKKAGFTIGTVGNGDPDNAGTIVVPTGKLDIGNTVKDALTNFTFTVTEDEKVKDITVTLGQPTE